jgi:hypothetical protein
MSAIEIDIQNIVKDNKRFHFQIELSLVDKNDVDRISKFEKIIKKLDYVPIKSNSEEKHKKMFEEIDKQVYAQPWNKLQKFHKETRIENYINEKFIDPVMRIKYIKMLKESLERGELNTVKIVTYDTVKAQITDINIFKKKDDSDEYFINIKKTKQKTT